MIYHLAMIALVTAQWLLVLAMGAAAVRMARGPRAHDRVLALDALTVDAMLLLLLIGIHTGTMLYAEAALIIALLGFASTAALARFLLRGEVIE